MTPRTTIKLSLALAGLISFGAGIRFENNVFRWTGIGLVAVAWLLRFWKAPPPPDQQS
ncbi:MAG: hypothetical protein H3C62_08350 [Gemmatimonadaceae bacterium]|nr:hypothetical protein [Gemmatimonadaceae bacterium]